MSFKDITFGKSAAEKELPHMLIDGFLDSYGYIDKITDEPNFLVLGPKGSGKSAIGVRLKLISDNKDDFFVEKYNLEDLPYKPFSKIIPSKEAREIKFQNDWEYVLLVALLNNIIKDYDSLDKNPNLNDIIDLLKNVGLLPSENLTQIVKTSTVKSFGAKAYVLNGEHTSNTEKVPFDISTLFETLKDVCYSMNMASKHFIIIDGLDDALTLDQKDRQYTLLGTLILVADRMNTKFENNDIPAKIVILCRTELFDKLPGSNNNKIKQDSAIMLNWYNGEDAKSSNLINLINLRASNSLKREVEVFDEFFPQTMTRFDKNTLKYLFHYTRHTPRDIIELMNYIQQYTKNDNPTEDDIWNGIKEYSTSYFLGEIRDELNGFLTNDQIDQTMRLMGSMRIAKFKKSDLDKKIVTTKGFLMLDLDEILDLLFDCNAIGNLDEDDFFCYKYRNISNYIIYDQDIVIHKGLWKALNLKSYNF
jgi:hypothetical protein